MVSQGRAGAGREQRFALGTERSQTYRFSFSEDLKHFAFLRWDYEITRTNIQPAARTSSTKLSRQLSGGTYRADIAISPEVRGRNVVTVDGKVVGNYDEVVTPVLFNKTGDQFAFVITERDRPYSKQVVHNGKQSPKYQDVTDLGFSPEGSHLAYFAYAYDGERKRTRCYAIIDGVEVGWCDRGKEIIFASDGSSFAWSGTRQKSQAEPRYHVFHEDREFGPYSALTALKFSTNGKRLAYAFSPQDRAGMFVLNDGIERFLHASPQSLTFSPDLKQLAYVSNDRMHLVTETETKEWVCGHSQIKMQFSPDGKRFAFAANLRTNRYVVVDGNAGPPHVGYIHDPVFSRTGKLVAYKLEITKPRERLSTSYLVVNGTQQRWPIRSKLLFSADGEHYAYMTEQNEKFSAVLDGRPGTFLAGVASLDSLTISSNGARTAWVLTPANQEPGYYGSCAVVDGKMQPTYRSVNSKSLQFSPSGRHFAYVASPAKGNGEFLVLNGIPSKPYQQILSSRGERDSGSESNCLLFDGEERIRYIARDATNLIIIEEMLPTYPPAATGG